MTSKCDFFNVKNMNGCVGCASISYIKPDTPKIKQDPRGDNASVGKNGTKDQRRNKGHLFSYTPPEKEYIFLQK